MAWYPGATRMELQPESDSQPAIRPTQFIVHSIIAPWTAKRTYEYWRDSTNLESHFGLGYEGDLGQFIGTETRADANYLANRRPDGTGAVSIETASNTSGTDPWTAAQVEELIKLGGWLHQQHGIPLRICPEWDAPGFGYHRLHPEWAKDGTTCPGDARVRQFKEVVFPGIVARATGKTPAPIEEDPMPTAAEVAAAVMNYRIDDPRTAGTQHVPLKDVLWWTGANAAQARATITAQTAAITTLAAQLGTGVDTATVVAAVERAIADATVRVDVNVNQPTH